MAKDSFNPPLDLQTEPNLDWLFEPSLSIPSWGRLHKTFFFINNDQMAVNCIIFPICMETYSHNLAIITTLKFTYA